MHDRINDPQYLALEHHLRWVAQTIHQAYHQDVAGTWEACSRDVCVSTKRILELGPTAEQQIESWRAQVRSDAIDDGAHLDALADEYFEEMNAQPDDGTYDKPRRNSANG